MMQFHSTLKDDAEYVSLVSRLAKRKAALMAVASDWCFGFEECRQCPWLRATKSPSDFPSTSH